MKKFLKKVSGTIIVAMMMSLLASAMIYAAPGELEGDGTSGNPYLIYNEEDLNSFKDIVNGDNPGACAALKADIEMSYTNPRLGLGTQEQPYSGVFDGNGCKITLNICGGDGNKGLFDYTSGAAIKNLKLAGKVQGTLSYVGALVGVASGGSFVNIESEADIDASANGVCAGGLIGYAQDAITMDKCSVTGNVTGGTYTNGVCGLIGNNHDESVVTNCYVTGVITGGNFGYGLSIKGKFINCYFAGDMINAWARVKTTNGECENVYFRSDANFSGGSDHANRPGNGEGLTTEQFESGEAAFLLGEAFGQKIGEDLYPVFVNSSNMVFEGENGYTNDIPEEGIFALSKEGNSYICRIVMKKSSCTSEDKKCCLSYAVYNDGEMNEFNFVELDCNSDDTDAGDPDAKISYTLNIEPKSSIDVSVSVFLWEGFENMKIMKSSLTK